MKITALTIFTIIILLAAKAALYANTHVIGEVYTVTPEISCMEVWDAHGRFETLCLESFGTDVRPVSFTSDGEIIRN